VRFGKRQRTTQFFAVLNMLRMAKKGVDGRRRRDGVTRSLPCATHKYSRHRKKKKRKKSKAGRGPPLPSHYHAVAGRRSSVPHASDATTTTP
jgi:hypothetical protein